MVNLIPDLMVLTGLGGLAALLLVTAARRFEPASNEVVAEINRCLPQTQCAQCGYPGCLPYAEAVAAGEAINLCPPGGDETIKVLATRLGREVLPLEGEPVSPSVAVIRESECIGCTLCIPACPVDAIVGAQQLMHTVIEEFCTGCELCIEPCPVDCIDLVPLQHTEPVPVFQPIETNCINCGFCESTCPRELQPQSLFWFREGSRNSAQLENLRLNDCIECFRCDRVCPSELPLTETFRASKAQLAQVAHEREAIQANEIRFIARQSRLTKTTDNVKKRPSSKDRQALLTALESDL